MSIVVGSESTTSDAWECVICYENGATTGQLTLACKHTVCLGCYTSMGVYHTSPTCPCCRSTINTGERAVVTPEYTDIVYTYTREDTNHLIDQYQRYVNTYLIISRETPRPTAVPAPAPAPIAAPVAAPAPTPAAAARTTSTPERTQRCVGCRNYFTREEMTRCHVRNADGTFRANRVLRCPGCGER